MDSIAITKPNMGTPLQDRPGLSPFGVLSQAFSQELLARAGFQEGRWPFVALDLLEEGEEAPADPPPVQPVVQVDLRLMLQHMRQLDIRTEKAVERVVERVIRLREQGRAQAVPVQPSTPGGGRREAAGQKSQTAGSKAAGEGRVQSAVRGEARQAAPRPDLDGGENAPRTPEQAVLAAGSFARLQNFYNTIHQHLQFTANIREPGLWRPDSPAPRRGTSKGLNRYSIERSHRAYGPRREQGRLPIPAPVPAGISPLAGAAPPLAAGNPSGLFRYDVSQGDTGPLTAGEPAYLEDGAGGAVRNGAADSAAGSREIRREAGRLERAIAAQAMSPDAWAPLFFARTLHPDAREYMRSAQTLHPDAWESMRSVRTPYPDAWEPMRSVRTLHPDARGSMRSVRTLYPDAWGSMRSLQTLHSDARQSAPSARTLRREGWNTTPGLGLWKRSAGGNLSGQGKGIVWPPRPTPQRPGGAEGPGPGGGKTAFAPSGGMPAIETAAPADQVHWGKNRWSISRLSAASNWLGAGEQGAAVPPRDAPVPAPLVDGELAHRIEPEGESLPQQGAFKTEPAGRGALGKHAIPTAAVQSAPVPHGRAAPGLEGVTARGANPVGANAAAREAQPAADAGELPSVFLEEVRPSSLTVGTWPRTERKERSVPPPFSELPGEELAHRAAPIGSEWDLGSALLAGRTQTSADRTRTSTDKAQTSADRMRTSTDKAQTSPDRTRTSTDRVQTSVGGAQITSDVPARLLEAAAAVQRGQPPRADPAAGQSKPPVSALRDIRAVKGEQSAAVPGGTPPGTSQTGEPLSALFEPGAELIHSAGLYRDSAPAPAEAGARTPAVLTAQAKGHRPQADFPRGKTRRTELSVQTGGRGAQDGAPRGQVQTGTAAGPIGQGGGTAALRHIPLAVHLRQGPLTIFSQDIRPFAAGRAELTAGAKFPRESRSAAPYRENFPPGEMIYGAQKDMTGAGKDARSHAAPSPLELTYGGTVQPSAAEAPAPAAGGQKPVQSSMESDYVRELPDWAKRFLREGAPQTREEAVRRLDTGREQTMGTAQNIAALPSFSEEAGTTFQWTAPDTRAPAPVEYREPRRQQELSQPQSIRISEAEVQRTADRVYRIIENRIRRERWRLGL